MAPLKPVLTLKSVAGWIELALIMAFAIELTFLGILYSTETPVIFSMIGGTVFAISLRAPLSGAFAVLVILFARVWLWFPGVEGVPSELGALAVSLSAFLPNFLAARYIRYRRMEGVLDTGRGLVRLFPVLLFLYIITSLPLYFLYQDEVGPIHWSIRLAVDCIGSTAASLIVGTFISALMTGNESTIVIRRIPHYLASLTAIALPVLVWMYLPDSESAGLFMLLLAVPAVLYISSNFAMTWALLGLILHSWFVVFATRLGAGPFHFGDPVIATIAAQAYIILVVLSGWIIGLHRRGQMLAYHALEAMNNHLEDIVSLRTGELESTNRSLVLEVELRRQAEEFLRQIMQSDPVTGLHNRQGLKALLVDKSIHSRLRAMVLISLENFSDIVFERGPDSGDQMLRNLTRRLQSRFPDPDHILVRFSEDRFVLLLLSARNLESLGQDIAAFLDRPDSAEEGIRPTALVGIVPVDLIRSAGADFHDEFYWLAISCLYELRRPGKPAWMMADADMRKRQDVVLLRLQEMRQALEKAEFMLHYQPIVSADCSRIEGTEALVRWMRDDGMMNPDDFIPLAERSGLIIPIGYAVLESVAKTCLKWREDGLDLSIFSVNVSIRQLAEEDFARRCLQLWDAQGCVRAHLKLEITESVLAVENPALLKNLEELRSAGVSIAFDDFGTGFSSLSYLDRFPVDSIKIDRGFVQRLSAGGNSRAVIEAIGLIAKRLGLSVIVEGVENERTLQQIRTMTEVSGWQGYYFGKPLAEEEFPEAVRQYSRRFNEPLRS